MPGPYLQLNEAIRETRLTVAARSGGVVPYGAWLDALRDVSVGIRSGHVVVLSGLPGVGKTSLLHALFTLLTQGGRSVAFFHPDHPLPPDAVLLVDDAHRMGEAALQAVLDHPAACVLAGGPALAILTGGLSRRVTTVGLHPVPPAAAAGFVTALMQEDGEASRFAPEAAERVQVLGRGLPGAMAKIARSAIDIAWEQSAAAVQLVHVEQARADQAGLPVSAPPAAAGAAWLAAPPPVPDRVPGAPAGRWPRWPLAAALAAAGLAGVLLAWPRPAGPPQLLAPPATTAFSQPEPQAPEPASAPASRTVPLPAAVPLHVMLLVPPGAAERAARVAETLALLGYDVAGQRAVAVRSATLEVWYGYAEDASAAARLAEAVGAGPPALRLPPGFPKTLSPPGAVEVMVPSAGPLRPGLPTARTNQGD